MKHGKFIGWLGKADVKVHGRYPEKFINLASASGVRMWDSLLSSEELYFKTDITSLKTLETVRDKLGYTMEVQRKSGLLVLTQFMLRRKYLLAGFLCFWIILFYLSGLVWKLEITGLEKIEHSEVVNLVETLGLRKWSWLRNVNLNVIEEELYLKFPEIAWVAVERSGTKISIRIVEKEYDPLQFGEAIDIVAEFDGIISEMMVMQGIPRVQPGMTVAKGDVLISGYMDNGRLINAAGSVKAVIFIEGYGEAGVEEVEKQYTGKEKVVRIMQIGGLSIPLTPGKHDFSEFEVVESVRFLRGNSKQPVRLVERKFLEVYYTINRYTPEQAEELAKERALLMAHQQVREHADLLKTEVRELTMENNIYRCKILLTFESKIGQEKVQIRREELGE